MIVFIFLQCKFCIFLKHFWCSPVHNTEIADYNVKYVLSKEAAMRFSGNLEKFIQRSLHCKAATRNPNEGFPELFCNIHSERVEYAKLLLERCRMKLPEFFPRREKKTVNFRCLHLRSVILLIATETQNQVSCKSSKKVSLPFNGVF